MPRPQADKKISGTPLVQFYKPNGICASKLEQVTLTLSEWEALRLFNKENLNQTQSSEEMGISQSTFQRILCSARKKLALAILDGKAIKIEQSSSSQNT